MSHHDGIDEASSRAPQPEQMSLLIGVLALQGAFVEHENMLKSCQNDGMDVTIVTRQVRTIPDLDGLDGLILPGGESTAMGLIGKHHHHHHHHPQQQQQQSQDRQSSTATSTTAVNGSRTLWEHLQDRTSGQYAIPIWGTCAGMILLANQCIGTSANIENGQALIGGIDILVCRNYFGSQISSFEMMIPPPPLLMGPDVSNDNINNNDAASLFPGVFIRAPAILSAAPDVTILGTVIATPCRSAATTLQELDRKIQAGENINDINTMSTQQSTSMMEIPTIADNNTNARQVICAAQYQNLLCTAFHPELTNDNRWHQYFIQMAIHHQRKYRQQDTD
jgi:pyridoxal 5'-phosphate synthase pdxT subunit